MKKSLFFKMTILELLRKRRITKEISKLDLYNGQPQMLKYIYHNEGCNQHDLAKFYKVTPASIAISTKRLEKKGFLAKSLNKENLREKRLYLTKSGKEAVENLEIFFENMDNTILKDIDEDKQRLAEEMLDKMIFNLTNKKLDEIDINSLFKEGETDEKTN